MQPVAAAADSLGPFKACALEHMCKLPACRSAAPGPARQPVLTSAMKIALDPARSLPPVQLKKGDAHSLLVVAGTLTMHPSEEVLLAGFTLLTDLVCHWGGRRGGSAAAAWGHCPLSCLHVTGGSRAMCYWQGRRSEAMGE